MDLIKVAKVQNVLLQKGRQAYLGTLHLTAHHLIFKYAEQDQELWVFYSTIHDVEKKTPNLQGYTPLHISCRNFVFIRLLIHNENEVNDVYESLSRLIHTSTPEQLYAFFFKPTVSFSENGWEIYHVADEYRRMGMGTRTDSWRISEVNKDYSLCPTYPKLLVVPSRISDNVIKYAAKFRSKARIPVLSYLHPVNNASITRCSQPMVGLKQNRSIQDEKYIEAIWAINNGVNNLIVDARPTANAMANAAKGAGTENMENYKNCSKVYFGIDNIHVMRDSLTKMVDAIQQAEIQGTPLNKALLGRSGWLKHIKAVLDGADTIVKSIESGSNVVVHCSDGWDRTSQLVALAELCLDPFYRTIKGFEVMIEKDWVSFGHKFADRCGHISTDYSTSSSVTASNAATAAIQKVQNRIYKQAEIRETSPVFHQFLDCVYQLWTQSPSRFEFNEKFLIQLHFHVYSCQFGTFLFNCDAEREEQKVRETTHSLWSFINSNRDEYLNPLYDAKSDKEKDGGVLRINTKYLRYWAGLFKQTEEDTSDLVVAVDEIGISTFGADGESIEGSLNRSVSDEGDGNAVGAVTAALGNTVLTGSKVVEKIGSLWSKFGLNSSGNAGTASMTVGAGMSGQTPITIPSSESIGRLSSQQIFSNTPSGASNELTQPTTIASNTSVVSKTARTSTGSSSKVSYPPVSSPSYPPSASVKPSSSPSYPPTYPPSKTLPSTTKSDSLTASGSGSKPSAASPNLRHLNRFSFGITNDNDVPLVTKSENQKEQSGATVLKNPWAE